jgi:hypothetical protein
MADNRYQGSIFKRKDSLGVTQLTLQDTGLSKCSNRKRFRLPTLADSTCFFQGDK